MCGEGGGGAGREVEAGLVGGGGVGLEDNPVTKSPVHDSKWPGWNIN